MRRELSPDASALLDALASGALNPSEVQGSIEEFALRSLWAGKRVREWCEELREVLVHVSYMSPFDSARRGGPGVLSYLSTSRCSAEQEGGNPANARGRSAGTLSPVRVSYRIAPYRTVPS